MPYPVHMLALLTRSVALMAGASSLTLPLDGVQVEFDRASGEGVGLAPVPGVVIEQDQPGVFFDASHRVFGVDLLRRNLRAAEGEPRKIGYHWATFVITGRQKNQGATFSPGMRSTEPPRG